MQIIILIKIWIHFFEQTYRCGSLYLYLGWPKLNLTTLFPVSHPVTKTAWTYKFNYNLVWYAYQKLLKKHLVFCRFPQKNSFCLTGGGRVQKVTDMSATIRFFFTPSLREARGLIQSQKSAYDLIYRPFHETLPSSSAFVNCISVRFMKQTVFEGKKGVLKLHLSSYIIVGFAE